MSQPRNNGYKIYTTLIQVNSATGLPTGLTKPNIPGDPNYLIPIYDPNACPLDIPQPQMDILLINSDSISVNYTLLYGTNQINRSLSDQFSDEFSDEFSSGGQSAVWTVDRRVYDGVIFTVTGVVGIYTMNVYYGINNIATEVGVGSSSFLITGPFSDIVKLEILLGTIDEFSTEFTNEFN